MKVPDHISRIASHPKVASAHEFSARMAPYWIGAAITAVVSVAYAKAFAFAEATSFTLVKDSPAVAFVTVPAAILFSTLLAEFYAPAAAGSGIPQLIAGVELSEKRGASLDNLFGIKMIIAKFIGSCACVLGGGVTGREGPNLQISAGIFNQIFRFWPKARARLDLQSMILAGGAAGLAAAFNTPLGGVVFAIEELAKTHISKVRTAVFHAVIIAGLCVQAILGNYLYIGKTTFAVSGATETVELAMAAMLIGMIGAGFGLASFKILAWRGRLPFLRRLAFTTAMALALAGLIQVYGATVMGSGREVIRSLLAENTQTVTPLVGVLRVTANTLTYGAGVIGGIFAPALSSGAGFGASIGSLIGTGNLQLWVLVGMVAFLTGVTRTPFTSTILVLEMTDSHEVIVVLMLAAIMAQGASKLIDPVSFYERASRKFVHEALPENHEHS